MHTERAIRVILALLLATWSPAWCHCMLLASSASHACSVPYEVVDGDVQSFVPEDCCSGDVQPVHALVQFADCCAGVTDGKPAGAPCQPCSCECCGSIRAPATPWAARAQLATAKALTHDRQSHAHSLASSPMAESMGIGAAPQGATRDGPRPWLLPNPVFNHTLLLI